jgi:mycofactocin precursor peptide peptidase
VAAETPGDAGHLALGLATWPTLADTPPVLLVPVGSLEQHGPALPLGTDTMTAVSVTREAVRVLESRGARVMAAPAIAYGASGEHEGFPGTISIGHEALRMLLVEFGRSACRWAEGVVFVNGHGGNAPTVVDAVRQLREEGRACAWTSCATPGGDAHAGATETALLLHLAPVAVRRERLEPGVTAPIGELMPSLREHGVRAVSPNGVLGDPTGSTPEEGRRIFGELVARLVREVADIDVRDDGRLTPQEPVR